MKSKVPGRVIAGTVAGLVIAGAVAAYLFFPVLGRSRPAVPSIPHPVPAVKKPVGGAATSNTATALDLYRKGLKLYYQRDYQPALDLFNQALVLDPQSYQALNAKGATYAFLGRYDEGIRMIQQAITMKPDFEYAHFNLGLAYELAGRWDQAIAAYKSAIALDRNDEWTYYGIAAIYGRQGNVPMTVKYLRRAIGIWSGVKGIAAKEKDFDNVRNDPRFQALLQ
ncbi:MAG: tetratricopeptide repeat protein [Peptococcaceae bacterium]|jgi:tetratricopeptide (TPR) repeat protein|nr:tetratricopeptide repeat protein [Peptococcaceae bacterium]